MDPAAPDAWATISDSCTGTAADACVWRGLRLLRGPERTACELHLLYLGTHDTQDGRWAGPLPSVRARKRQHAAPVVWGHRVGVGRAHTERAQGGVAKRLCHTAAQRLVCVVRGQQQRRRSSNTPPCHHATAHAVPRHGRCTPPSPSPRHGCTTPPSAPRQAHRHAHSPAWRPARARTASAAAAGSPQDLPHASMTSTSRSREI